MRVLIIGCGYIGLPLGEKLVSHGHAVFGMRRTPVVDTKLSSCGIVPVCADITKPQTLAALSADHDWVVHCVASAGGSVEEYRQLYLEGTRNVIEWLASSPPQKFVYTSSTSVYGQIDGSIVDEISPTEPVAETAKILVETERLLLRAAGTAVLKPIILRVAGIYGPGRGYWLNQYSAGQARLEGHGERYLNMVHRDDVVGAIAAALERGRAGEIYNVVDDEPTSQAALFQWLSIQTGCGLPPPADEKRSAGSKRGFTHKRVSNRKLNEQVGYCLRYPSFRQGFARELDAFRPPRQVPPQ